MGHPSHIRLRPSLITQIETLKERFGCKSYDQVVGAGLDALGAFDDPAAMSSVPELTATLDELVQETAKLCLQLADLERLGMHLHVSDLTPPVHETSKPSA